MSSSGGGLGTGNSMGGNTSETGNATGTQTGITIEVGRNALQDVYGTNAIRIEIYGVINIFNQPNQEEFLARNTTQATDSSPANDALEETQTSSSSTEGNSEIPSSGTNDSLPATSASSSDTTGGSVDPSLETPPAPAPSP